MNAEPNFLHPQPSPPSKSSGSSGQGQSGGPKTGMGLPPGLTLEGGRLNAYALLIGVGRSANPQWSLPVSARDVVALRKVLVDPKLCAYPDDAQRVRVLTDELATRENILSALDELAQTVAENPDATVTICYTGHGWRHENDGYFLIPHNVKPFDLAETALPAEVFSTALNKIRTRRLLVMLDTCHAEGMAEAKASIVSRASAIPIGFNSEALSEALINELSRGKGRAVFTSCLGDQKSWILRDGSLSIFTHHLIEALKGAGNRPGDKVVEISDLMNYVSRKVKGTAREMGLQQTPFFKFETENFPVALIRGGDGLSEESETIPVEQLAEEHRQEAVAGGTGSKGDTNIAGRNVITARDINNLQVG